MSMRTLVAAKRAYPSLLKKDLTTGIQIVLDRATEVNPMTANGQHHSHGFTTQMHLGPRQSIEILHIGI